MLAFLSGSEKGLPVGRTLLGGVHGTQNLSELSPHSSKPFRGRTPHSYLVVSDFATSAALVRERDRVQQPVYYYNRALRGAEERYPKMEKLILALVTTSRKLRPYFQANTIEVPTEYPMKQTLYKPKTSGMLIKWAIELSEFDIRYKSRIMVKEQILADFIMEFNPAQSMGATQLAPDLPIWRLSVDGAANAQGSGARLILTSPDVIDTEYALRFGFQTSNNEAEYEAVIAGLNLAHFMEADQLEVSSDSQLVVKQIEDSYDARGEKMILYLKKVREFLKKFIRVQVKHVPRAENSRANALAKLATTSQEDLGRLIPIEHLPEPSVSVDNREVSPVMSEPS